MFTIRMAVGLCMVFLVAVPASISFAFETTTEVGIDTCASCGPCEEPMAFVEMAHGANACPGSASSNPVRYIDGMPVLKTDGISCSAIGGQWSFYLTYLSRWSPEIPLSYDSDYIESDAGFSWVTSIPRIAFVAGDNDLRLQVGTNVTRFTEVPGGNEWHDERGKSYATITIDTVGTTDYYKLQGVNGGYALFHKDDDNRIGMVHEIRDPAGNRLDFGYYGDDCEPYSHKPHTIYVSPSGHEFRFSYNSITGNLTSVYLKLGGTTQSYMLLYYLTSETLGRGSPRDLYQIAVRQ